MDISQIIGKILQISMVTLAFVAGIKAYQKRQEGEINHDLGNKMLKYGLAVIGSVVLIFILYLVLL